MIEIGIVTQVDRNIAHVKMVRGEQCSGCTACKAFGEGIVELLAVNNAAAKIGDHVEVEIDPKQVVKHSSVVFLLPVFGLILGYYLGATFLRLASLSQQNAGIIGSLGLMVFMFGVIMGYDRWLARSQTINATINRIL